jgi:hypothetical protein
VFNGHG